MHKTHYKLLVCLMIFLSLIVIPTSFAADADAYSMDEQKTFYALYGGSLAGCGRKEEGEAMIRKAEAMGYGNGNTIRKIAGLPV